METPAAHRSFCQRSPSTPVTTSDTAIRSSSLNQVRILPLIIFVHFGSSVNCSLAFNGGLIAGFVARLVAD